MDGKTTSTWKRGDVRLISFWVEVMPTPAR
jgi:hypothetical protein